jgi:prepilin-type processing-associated H-X9-DG protein
LLVVIGIIAILVAILLPTLSAARKRASATQCMSNIRQLLTASIAYQQENKGFWPPAHINYVYPSGSENLNRWHGTRPAASKPFSFDGSVLKPFLRTPAIKLCPSFEPAKAGFEAACGGYGYNERYIGASMEEPSLAYITDLAQYNQDVANRPAKQNMIRHAAAKIAFADCAMATPSLIEYSFAEPPYFTYSATQLESSPSLHFRHGSSSEHRCNIGWADGHVTAELFEWTYGTNAYGASSQKFLLGFFGPHDNSLFQRN